MLTKNQTIKTEITDMNNLGYGISRQDGIVIFTDGGVTGDVLEIKIIKTAKDYAVGRVERVLVPSEKRDDSLCKVSKRCGGCAFRGINREYELELKRGFVMSAFRKNRVDAVINPVLTDGRDLRLPKQGSVPRRARRRLRLLCPPYPRHNKIRRLPAVRSAP